MFSKDVQSCADHIVERVTSSDAFQELLAGKDRPTPETMTQLAAHFGFECVPLYASKTAFKARLFGKYIYYNGNAHPDDQCVYIWHENNEGLASAGTPILFEDHWPHDYTGSMAPRDFRHLVARCSEGHLFKMFPKLTNKKKRYQNYVTAMLAARECRPGSRPDIG